MKVVKLFVLRFISLKITRLEDFYSNYEIEKNEKNNHMNNYLFCLYCKIEHYAYTNN